MSGGPLPVDPPFDIYCVGPCGPMAFILTHPEVSTVGSSAHFLVDGISQDLIITSGGYTSADEVELIISTSVPGEWTFDFTCKFVTLPTNFSDLLNSHIFIGVSDAEGVAGGLFFSKVGLAYAGGLQGAIQPLADSQTLITEGEYYTFRLVASYNTGAFYVYVTKTSDLLIYGHQLRYILPTIAAQDLLNPSPDQTLVSVRGTVSRASTVALDSTCLGSGLIIPNLPPIADAGTDQAGLICSVILLDGSKSFDPEGLALTYLWQLVDAPLGSQFIFDGKDGYTYPLVVPTGFTNLLHSYSLYTLDQTAPILPGDVLTVEGVSYTILGKGTDLHGFYVRINEYALFDGYTNSAFKLLPQHGLNNKTSVKATFYPDIPGLYKFSLVVSDGAANSPTVYTVANILESAIPRGCTPNLSFVWNYLSDFWRLVEDKERIEVFWGALVQVAATELMSLWEVNYSKSLRDVQRTFLRRWLHVDPLLEEVLPELTTTRVLYAGLTSGLIWADIGWPGVAGTHLDLVFLGAVHSVVFPAGPDLTGNQIRNIIYNALVAVDARIRVDALVYRPDTTNIFVRILAPFGISISPTSTLPDGTVFGYTSTNKAISNQWGAAVGVDTYLLYDLQLSELGIKDGDVLELDGVGYRIAKIADDPTDILPYQRVVLRDHLPVNAPVKASICNKVTSPDLDFYKALVSKDDVVIFEVIDNINNTVVNVMERASTVLSSAPGELCFDFTSVGDYIAQSDRYSVFFFSLLRRTYIPIDSLIADLPTLQESIKVQNDQEVLRRNVDFFLEQYREVPCVRFISSLDKSQPDVWEYQDPPERLWAETVYIDNRPTIEANFGLPAQFTLDDLSQLPSSVDYLSAVRGLWYSYFSGPTVFNVRAGAQILLGLPFAEENGTIEEIRRDFGSHGRILVRDTANTAIVRSYTFLSSLPLETNPSTGKAYVVGDSVAQFAPLVQGVEVLDWLNDPKWFAGYLSQGTFVEYEKFQKFLVRVSSDAFNLQALLFTRQFVLRIKPRYTYPMFVVLESLTDEVSVTDELENHGGLYLTAGATFNLRGAATMVDQPMPYDSNHGESTTYAWDAPWWNKVDLKDHPYLPGPVYQTDTIPDWGADKEFLAPEQGAYGILRTTFGVDTLPSVDSIFRVDEPAFTSMYIWEATHLVWLPALSYGAVTLDEATRTVVAAETLNYCVIEVNPTGLDPGSVGRTYRVHIFVNGTEAVAFPFSMPPTGTIIVRSMSVAVLVGDVLDIRVSCDQERVVLWHHILVTVGVGTDWAVDVELPAGTYTTEQAM